MTAKWTILNSFVQVCISVFFFWNFFQSPFQSACPKIIHSLTELWRYTQDWARVIVMPRHYWKVWPVKSQPERSLSVSLSCSLLLKANNEWHTTVHKCSAYTICWRSRTCCDHTRQHSTTTAHAFCTGCVCRIASGNLFRQQHKSFLPSCIGKVTWGSSHSIISFSAGLIWAVYPS